jgi:hypothetical protein
MANDKIALIFSIFGIFALIFSLIALLPQDYNELQNLPDLSPYSNPQSFPYANITGIPNIDLQHGLCLWLPFDGSVLDRSGCRFDGSIVGNASFTNGVFDRGIEMDGNDYVEVPHNSVLELTIDFSIVAWVKISVHNNYRFIVVKGYSNVPRPYEFRINPLGQLELMLFDTTYRAYIGTAIVPINEFAHVAVTKEKGEKVRFYINRVLDVALDEGNINQVTGTDNLLIGTRADKYTYFNGVIDDVRIYNRVLSSYEIEHLYSLGV